MISLCLLLLSLNLTVLLNWRRELRSAAGWESVLDGDCLNWLGYNNVVCYGLVELVHQLEFRLQIQIYMIVHKLLWCVGDNLTAI